MASLTHTVGGDIANFRSATRVPIESLKCHFLPIQEGTGDPSPDNIRPITGWNEVEVERCGKNLLPSGTYTKEVKDQGILLEYNDGILHIKSEGTGTNQYVFLGLPDSFSKYIPKGTYTLSGGTNKYGSGYITIYLLVNNKDIEFKTTNANSVTKTLEDSNIKLQVAVKTNLAMDVTLYPQLETGSVATEYEPYYSEQIPITFPVIGKNKYEVTALDSGDWTGMGYNDNYLTRINPSIDTTNKTITITTIGSGSSQFQKKTHFIPGTYTFSFDMTSNVRYLEKRMTIVCFDKNDNILTDSAISIAGLTWNQYYRGFFSAPGTFTIPDTVNYFTVAIGVGNDNGDRVGAQVTFSNIQLELGTVVTSYEEYNPDNTVYGGYVDIAKGELVAEYASYTFTGSEKDEFVYVTTKSLSNDEVSERHSFNTAIFDNIAERNSTLDAYCNIGAPNIYNLGRKGNIIYYIGTPSQQVNLSIDSSLCEPTVESFSQWLSEHPLQLVYKLATPVTYPLTPTQLTAFLNANNIWSNTNSITEISYAIHDSAPIRAAKHRIAAAEPHVETANGNLAHFKTDMIAPIKSAKIYFNPVQEGSGDPSPSNVRPITGWTGLTVYHSGENLYVPNENNKGYIKNDGTIVVDDHSTYTNLIPVVTGDIYSFKCTTVSINGSTNRRLHGYDSSGNWGSQVTVATTAENTVENCNIIVTIPSGISYIRVSFRLGDANPRVAKENAYEVNWNNEGTIYGGYIDLINGKLVQEYKSITFNGSESGWDTYGAIERNDFCATRTIYDKMVGYQTSICNELANINACFAPYAYAAGRYCDHSTNKNIYICMPDQSITTLETFKSWLADNPLQLVYKLNTPIEYSLTSTQLKTLRGTNNIFSSANGNIEVAYWKH